LTLFGLITGLNHFYLFYRINLYFEFTYGKLIAQLPNRLIVVHCSYNSDTDRLSTLLRIPFSSVEQIFPAKMKHIP